MRATLGPVLLLFALAAGGCDSSQPALVESKTALLDFRATGATTTDNRTWLMFEDSNQDGMPDDVDADGEGDVYVWCEPVPNSIVAVQSSAPWGFVITVKILRAGQTTPEILVQSLESSPARARYDAPFPGTHSALLGGVTGIVTIAHPAGRCQQAPDILCNPDAMGSTLCADNDGGVCQAQGTCSSDPSQACTPGAPGQFTCERLGLGPCDVPNVQRRFVFRNDATRQRASSASEYVLLTRRNILSQASPNTALALTSNASGGPMSTGGICPGTYQGPASIGGFALPFDFVLEKGATVIVEARRLSGAPGGIQFFAAPSSLTASFTVNGAAVSVDGNLSVGSTDEFIQFFYRAL